jgi:predicted secreted hydrolase
MIPTRVRRLGLILWLGLALGLVPRAPASGSADPHAPVVDGVALVFPRDTGAHPDFRTEWWYVTGWLTDDAGLERGFQVTFFRVATGIGADNPSRFAPRQLILAHAAIADPAVGRLRHAERIERAIEPLTGVDKTHTGVWIGDWTLAMEPADGHYRTRIDAEEFGLDLTLTPPGQPILNGRDGLSQKTPNPVNASYYYSRPQLDVSGRLRLDDRDRPVSGVAWLDHEWSSELMPNEAQGWDWIGVNLDSGGSLMAFQMRRADGSALWSSGTLKEGDAPPLILAPEQVIFTPLRQWRSPRTGANYPVEWSLEIDGRRLRLTPMMDDQELDGRRSTGIVYWEGAVRLEEGGREIGRGYLEMTGYGRRPENL